MKLFNSPKFKLEKTIWTETDFEKMGWHDASVYAICFSDPAEIDQSFMSFDLDYIFKWVHPKAPESSFSFWVSPCTLIFENVINLKMEFESDSLSPIGLEIADINKLENVQGDTKDIKWQIKFQTGVMEFQSSGFRQIVRRKPIFSKSQSLSFGQRKGISFSGNACNNFR